MRICFYHPLNPDALPGYKKFAQAIAVDNFVQADVRKIDTNLYRARLNIRDRLLFSLYRYQGETVCLVLEYVNATIFYRLISLVLGKEPELKIAQQLVLGFYRILKTPNKSQLSSWFTRVHESGSAELRRMAAGMEADAAAICEAISSRWSNGVVEGHVNRLKMLKRQMYGRAGFELLRQRVMSPLA